MAPEGTPTASATLPDLILRAAREYRLWRPGARVLVGVSGGPDSVALLAALAELPRPCRPELVAASLNHGLRAGAAAELQAVARLAAELGVPFESGVADVREVARAEGCGLEAAARRARYAFLARAAARRGARIVAVGHHRDDQAETVLLRLIRGAGSRGLAGMRPRRVLLGPDGFRGWLVRPLWLADRAQILAYLRERALQWSMDETNADLGPARNRVRHEVLPLLERSFGPGVRRTLARAAEHLAEEDAALVLWAARVASRRRRGAGLDVGAGWARVPRAVRARVLQGWWEAETGLPTVSAALLWAMDALSPGTGVDLPGGMRAVREGDVLTLRSRGASPADPVPLPVPGAVEIPGLGRVTARLVQWPDPETWARVRAERKVAVGDLEAVALPLTVRAPRPGERVRALGTAGVRPVRELLRDAGLPASLRTLPSLVTDSRGRVLWVAGARPADGFRVGEETRRALVLTLEPADAIPNAVPRSLS